MPNLLFGSLSLIAGLLSLLLPETKGTQLPDTIEEAELIGRQRHKQHNKEIQNIDEQCTGSGIGSNFTDDTIIFNNLSYMDSCRL